MTPGRAGGAALSVLLIALLVSGALARPDRAGPSSRDQLGAAAPGAVVRAVIDGIPRAGRTCAGRSRSGAPDVGRAVPRGGRLIDRRAGLPRPRAPDLRRRGLARA